MRRSWVVVAIALSVLTGACTHAAAASAARPVRPILLGNQLQSGFDMGVNTSGSLTGWVSPKDDYFVAAYPAQQDWGAIFVTAGPVSSTPSKSLDFGAFGKLLVDLRGATGKEHVSVGIRDVSQPADGTEAKLSVTPGTAWRTYSFPVSAFSGANVRRLYLIFELVFPAQKAETVYFRNVRYVSR